MLENESDAPDLSENGTPVDIGGQIFAHRSVMLYPCMDALAIKPDGIYVDGTAGGGGHSYEIAKRLTSGSGNFQPQVKKCRRSSRVFQSVSYSFV